jgi:DNA-binding beta-propeller fold protein YncE
MSRGSLSARLVLSIAACLLFTSTSRAEDQRYLYVAAPGIRDYLQYGGHGLLVFDIDRGHKFVKRIRTSGVDAKGKPLNVKGICASAGSGRVYISTTQTMACYDLVSEQKLWEHPYDDGCDRMSISPDGKVIYLPSFEKDHWNVVDAQDGHVISKIVPKSGSHNTVYAIDGKHAYLAGLKSPLLTVTDTATHTTAYTVGPFSAAIRPFTVDGAQTLCFVNVNELLGFEIGDLRTKKMLHRVEVQGYKPGPVKRHGCPSHGIGLTPDEKELWVVDGYNQSIHIFDNTVMPPKQLTSLKVREEPGWITFSIDGKLAYPSTGEVIDVATRKTLTTLSDDRGAPVMSEKMLEIDFRDGKPFRNGDQFGLGKVVAP